MKLLQNMTLNPDETIKPESSKDGIMDDLAYVYIATKGGAFRMQPSVNFVCRYNSRCYENMLIGANKR